MFDQWIGTINTFSKRLQEKREMQLFNLVGWRGICKGLSACMTKLVEVRVGEGEVMRVKPDVLNFRCA